MGWALPGMNELKDRKAKVRGHVLLAWARIKACHTCVVGPGKEWGPTTGVLDSSSVP